MTLQTDLKSPTNKLQAVIENVEHVIYGKREAIRNCVVGLLAEGHVLLEDVPGTGKTTVARALAKSIDVGFTRVQFTSDLLPADLLGVAVLAEDRADFVFRPGPIFGNIVLADELNRTTPRTQSALLECMAERRVTAEGETRELPAPFFVIATQNPLEFEGTYPLPESQLDRFLLCVRLGYPSRDVERQVLLSRVGLDPLEAIGAVMTRDELLAEIEAVREVRVDEALLDYVLDVVEATRDRGRFLLGASPRAGLGWMRAAQAMARIEGREFCVPDDFKRLAVPVLAHRVVPLPTGGGAGDMSGGEGAVRALLDAVAAPE
ncbi:MAG: MoxR family ATPase [Planctomycetota bacterium]